MGDGLLAGVLGWGLTIFVAWESTIGIGVPTV